MTNIKEKLNIAYIDYLDTKESFLYFKALCFSLNKNLSKKINLYLFSNLSEDNDFLELKEFFNNAIYGRSKKNMEAVLDTYSPEIQLGIVPHLTEFDLSKSAIEFISRKIPVLCGNRGREHKILKNDFFEFNIGNPQEFEEKLTILASKPEILNDFWSMENEVAFKFTKTKNSCSLK